ncbi:hypothetical protein G6011_04460 [Alternaria panax]|uniref:N-acetyltransferase domain-containing protein n=1 Tax=Alternaria panax TaxID=48097 RepID=A0AAD4NUZ2_9PLEO|nr:hypothetical protein G6011_04460 [Alternaria panax]
MEHDRRPATQGNSLREERTYRDPASIESIDYRIRSEPNHLYEDPDMDEDILYRIIPGDLVTRRQLQTCAEQFSSNYGVWSQRAHFMVGPWAKYGKDIRLSRERLRAQCLPNGANNILVVVISQDGRQIGHCFVSQWMHGDDRVWWITQLLVLQGYRNQRRATKMLQVLAMHYNVGRSTQRDLVGVATSNPYTVCTVLRVFGRGIEVLPSKTEWETNPVRHMPLPSSACEPIIKAAPVNYIRNVKMLPGKLTANTRFFVDHTAPDEALKRILYSMNKQVTEPWEWLFGHLGPGYEYVCVLEYSLNLEYKMDSALCGDWKIPNGTPSKQETPHPVRKSFRMSSTGRSEQSPSLIRYGEIDRYLFEVPRSCLLDRKLGNRVHAFLHGSTRKLIFEAKELIANTLMLPTIMSAKQIPHDLRRVYQSSNMYFPLSEQVQTWSEFTEYAYGIFEGDINVTARLLILQAIHFKELRDNYEKSQGVRRKKALELAKVERAGKASQSAKEVQKEPANQPPGVDANAPRSKDEALPAKPQEEFGFTPTIPPRKPFASNPKEPFETAGMLEKTVAFIPQPRTTSMLSSIGSPFRRSKVPIPRRSLSESKPRGSIPTTNPSSNTPALQQQTPPQTPSEHISEPATQTESPRPSVAPRNPVSAKLIRQDQSDAHAVVTPPATPRPFQPQANFPHYMAPTMGSLQRCRTHSPELFYSDESNDGCRLNLSGQPFLKNSGKILDRARWKRG